MTFEVTHFRERLTAHKLSALLLIILFSFITFLQYAESLSLPEFLSNANENIGLTRYSLERMLYLLPIIWAGFLFGWKGGAITATIALAGMLPRGILISPHPEDAIVESIAVFIIGNTVAFSLESLQKERERRAELESAQQELRSQLQIIEENERRLAALNQTASIISQSLELSDVLESAMNCVIDVMNVEVIRIYILYESKAELELAAHRGVAEDFVKGVRNIKLGEGFNGRVAQTGESLFVEDTAKNPELTRIAVAEENIRSQVIAPLMAKGKVVGTISAAMRSYRQFQPEEINLLSAIANQIGVAVDNARLYQQERETAEQLKLSEERYRGLFEKAHDAIWLYDLDDNIVAANDACVELTGYTLQELYHLKASELISQDTLGAAKGLEERLLSLQTLGSRGEVKLTRKDGSEAIIQLASNVIFGNGHPMGVQHIARDVTEEKRMQENLRLFVQQVTRAQEEERKRIAQELHDDTAQALVIHARSIEDLSCKIERMQKEQIPAKLEELFEQTNLIINGVRRLSQDLRPAALDRLGLVSAVEWIADQMAGYSGLDIKVQFLGEERRLADEVELVLFRITQEALRNVCKHAQATQADVIVEFQPEQVRITVKDNGNGFDVPDSVADLPRYGMLGLAGMQERARLLDGTLEVTSENRRGTTVVARLPV